VITAMTRNAPPGMPNVFLIDISPKDRDAVLDTVKQQRGLEGAPELIGTVAAKLIEVDGRAVENMQLRGWGRRLRTARPVTSAAARPAYVDITTRAVVVSFGSQRRSAGLRRRRNR